MYGSPMVGDRTAGGDFDGDRAIAVLAATPDPMLIVRALRGRVNASGGRQVLNHILIAAAAGEHRLCLQALAEDPVRSIVTSENWLWVAMPPPLALAIGTDGLRENHIVTLLLQAHRFVSIHAHTSLPCPGRSASHRCIGRCIQAPDRKLHRLPVRSTNERAVVVRRCFY